MCELLLFVLKNKVDKTEYGHTNHQRNKMEKPSEYGIFKGHKATTKVLSFPKRKKL